MYQKDMITQSPPDTTASAIQLLNKNRGGFLRSLLSMLHARGWLRVPTPMSNLRGEVTGTLFGRRHGHVCFVVQEERKSDPVLFIELATKTATLVREMSSGAVRIRLEHENPPAWMMYCNGKKCGFAMSRPWTESDWQVLSLLQSVSVGAGVIPVGCGGEEEVLYMRARFERVVGSRHSETFYMLNPDGRIGPELSIFLMTV